MRRAVTLVHRFGGTETRLEGVLLIAGTKNAASKVFVKWPLGEEVAFVASTGRMHKRPRGTWRLSEDDVKAFCEAAKISPQYNKPLRPLTGSRRLAQSEADSPAVRKFKARQLALRGTG